MNQTRRQFFKTLAATAAGVVAVGVAPRVVGGESDRSVVSPISDPGIKKTYMDNINRNIGKLAGASKNNPAARTRPKRDRGGGGSSGAGAEGDSSLI